MRIVASNPTLTANTFIGNASAAVSMDLSSDPRISGVTTTNNALNGLAIDAGTITGLRSWDDPDIVYRLSGAVTVAAGATLTIAPGQVIKAQDFANPGNEIIVNGTLVADGTPTQKILFASLRDDRSFDILSTADDQDTNNNGTSNAGVGEWKGIVFNAGSAGNLLDYVEVRSAGDFAAPGGIIVNGAPLTMTNSVVRDSETSGLRIIGANPTLTNITVIGSVGGAMSMDLASNPAISGVTLMNNFVNGLSIDSGTLVGSRTWDDPDIVYRLNGDVIVDAGSTLTISAGQIVKARAFSGDEIIVNGTLRANGTFLKPVSFTSDRDDTLGGDTTNNGLTAGGTGDWAGIRFNSTSTANVLDHVNFLSGASGGRTGVGGIVANGAPLTISHSFFRFGSGYVIAGRQNANISITSSQFIDNGSDASAVRAESGSTVNVFNNTFDGNVYAASVNGATLNLVNNIISNSGRSGVFRDGSGTVNTSFNIFFNPVAAVGNFEGMPDESSINGNRTVDPKYINRSLRDFRVLADSPAIDAGTSTGAPATDFTDSPRFDDPGIANLGAGSQPFYDIGAFERQQASDPQNLVIRNVGLNQSQVRIGDAIIVNWTVANTETRNITGDWSDAVFASKDNVWDLGDTLIGGLPHTGGLASGASYNGQISLQAPPSVEGTLYFIVHADARQQVREANETDNEGVATTTLDVPALQLGVATAGQFTAVGQKQYYRIDVPANRTLNFAVDSSASSGRLALFVSEGSVPTTATFDVRSPESFQPDQRANFSLTDARTYYVLVSAEAGAAATAPYILTATLPGFDVSAISPAVAGNTGQVTLEIQGSDLPSVSEVSLIGPNSAIVKPLATYYGDGTRLYATFDLTGVTPGLFDVRVFAEQRILDAEAPSGEVVATIEQDGQQVSILAATQVLGDDTLNDVLRVTAGGTQELLTRLLVPSAARISRSFPFHLEVINRGSNDIPSPVLLVHSPNGTPLSLTPNVDATSATQVQVMPLSSTGLPTVLKPGERVLIPLYGFANQNPGSQIVVQDLTSPGLPLNFDELESYYRDDTSDAVWTQTFSNFKALVGDSWPELHAAMRLSAAEFALVQKNEPFVGGQELINDLLVRARAGQRDASGFIPFPTGTGDDDPLGVTALQSVAARGFAAAAAEAAPISSSATGFYALEARGLDGCTVFEGLSTAQLLLNEAYARTYILGYITAVKGGNAAREVYLEYLNNNSTPSFHVYPEDHAITQGHKESATTAEVVERIWDTALIELQRRMRGASTSGVRIAPEDLPANQPVSFELSTSDGKGLFKPEQLDSTLSPFSSNRYGPDPGFYYADALHYGGPGDANTIPAVLTGGVGKTNKGLPPELQRSRGSDAWGDDQRKITGSITLTRIVEDGKTVRIAAESNFRIFVKDTVDFCPGDLGEGFAVTAATVTLARLEANGAAADVGFQLEFASNKKFGAINCPPKFNCDKPPEEPPAPGNGPNKPSSAPPLKTDGTTVRTVQSLDPNDITGPAGVGAGRFLRIEEPLDYTIRFENDPRQASAPAQQVVVKTTLDPEVDLATFELGVFGFGSQVVQVPQGLKSFSASVQTTNPDGAPLQVDISAELNLDNRVVTWVFSSVDPATGLPPSDPFAGFLPPNNATHAGEGFLTYLVQPRANLGTGDRVDAMANIVFDENPAILTNTEFNTFDITAPTSAVAPLPATSNPTFTVSWAGTDAGSGIATYDVFVSDNSGSPTLFLNDTTQAATTFTGQPGHTYSFFTIARDNVGFVELPAAVADAVTTVSIIPDTLSVASSDALAAETKAGGASDGGTFTITRTGNLAAALIVPYTVAGTATSGTDYRALSGNVEFAAGSATATVDVSPLDDKLKEGTESVVLTVQPLQGFVIANDSAAVAILDDDVATISVTASDDGAAETAKKSKKDIGTLTFTREGKTKGKLVVEYTVSGSATGGEDYKVLSGKVAFKGNSKTAKVKITPSDDVNFEDSESVVVNIATSSKYNIGATSSATVTIADNDAQTLRAAPVGLEEPGGAELFDGVAAVVARSERVLDRATTTRDFSIHMPRIEALSVILVKAGRF